MSEVKQLPGVPVAWAFAHWPRYDVAVAVAPDDTVALHVAQTAN